MNLIVLAIVLCFVGYKHGKRDFNKQIEQGTLTAAVILKRGLISVVQGGVAMIILGFLWRLFDGVERELFDIALEVFSMVFVFSAGYSVFFCLAGFLLLRKTAKKSDSAL